MASPTTFLHIVLLCGPLSMAEWTLAHRAWLAWTWHTLVMRKVYICVRVSLLLFQATYKGWLDIMDAAVDSRGVSWRLTMF